MQCEFNLAFAQHRDLVWPDQAHRLGELAYTRRPPIEQAQLQGHDRHLRHTNKIDHADQEKIPGHLLADFLAQERALQIGQNSVRLHVTHSIGKGSGLN